MIQEMKYLPSLHVSAPGHAPSFSVVQASVMQLI